MVRQLEIIPPRRKHVRARRLSDSVDVRLRAGFDDFAARIGDGDVAGRLAGDRRGGLLVDAGGSANPGIGGEFVVVQVEFAVVDRGDKAKIKVNNRHLVIGCQIGPRTTCLPISLQ